jgi:glycosyltransferase involved in cell wall biosynthesis
MKILQLCHKPPVPAVDGGCIAMNNITQGLLKSGHQVKIITIFTHKHDFLQDEMNEDYIAKTDIEGVFVDTRLNVMDAYASFMTSDSYHVNRFFSTDFDIKLTRTLKAEKYDVIHLESLFMTPYMGTIRRLSKAPVVVRTHNLEYVIWEKIAKGTSNVFKRIYLSYLSRKLKNYELKTLNEVHGIASISEEDKKRFERLGIRTPMKSIPFGIDYNKYSEYPEGETEQALFHLGSMDWSPNQEGILWFLQEIWPKVHALKPNLKLYLAGRNMPNHLLNRSWPNVSVIGEVLDAKQFMKSKAIMIVPLLSAGGIRVKIIEGLALGKAIISTSIGAEGIDCIHDQQLLIADSISEWVKGITRLIDEEGLIERLGRAGQEHTKNFDNDHIIEDLIHFYKKIKTS